MNIWLAGQLSKKGAEQLAFIVEDLYYGSIPSSIPQTRFLSLSLQCAVFSDVCQLILSLFYPLWDVSMAGW